MKRKDVIVAGLGGLAVMSTPATTLAQPPRADLSPPKTGPVTVAVVVGNGATVIDFAGPWEVFQDALVPNPSKPDDQQAAFQVAMISDKAAPLEATGGMIIQPRFTYETAPANPNVIVIGAQGEHTPAKIEWIRQAAKSADLVVSVCTGAFLLAKTGLLDGLTATTHHDFYDAFEKRFPRVHLVRGPRYVEHGKIATAGGLTSGIELALRVVQRYFGDRSAGVTAYYMEYNRSDRRPTA